MWWITAACAVLALSLVATAWRSPGPIVTIEFAEGHGIQPGDPVRLRGIDVGVVEHVVLDAALERVRVTARLMREARQLAREGTLFWIERPQVGLDAVRGLDTVVGPKYVGVQPGPSDGPARDLFVGVESPRQVVGDGKHTLTLQFRQGHGIRAGSPVRFRGVQVGEVVDVGLSASGSEVLVRVELRGEPPVWRAQGVSSGSNDPRWAWLPSVAWTRWSRDRIWPSVQVRPMVRPSTRCRASNHRRLSWKR